MESLSERIAADSDVQETEDALQRITMCITDIQLARDEGEINTEEATQLLDVLYTLDDMVRTGPIYERWKDIYNQVFENHFPSN
jgi:hypothetical protein